MPLTTINAAKELAVTYRPVVLATFTFPDATVLRVSTHNADSSTGGYSYGGQDYLPRIDDEDIERLASLSEQGIDRIPAATLRLADPDAWIWSTYERGHGFKGAQLLLRLVLFDPTTGTYSSDSLLPFVGICDKPGIDARHLTVSAAAKLNLSRILLPTIPVQQRCPWVNPVTLAQRAAADDPASVFYFCGETRDLGTAPPCAYTKATCTRPNRYGGVTWSPEQTGAGREYLSGNRVSWRNADTSARYREYVPLLLGGLVWVDAVVTNVVGDGNYTRGEAIVGVGPIDVRRVIVNGIELTFAPGMRGDFRWHYVNNGARDGAPNPDAIYDGAGDPYGNLTAIQFLATRNVIDPASLPVVRVLAERKTIRIYRRIAGATGTPIVITFDGPNEDCAGNPPFQVHVEGCSLAAANGTWNLSDWTYGPPGTITLAGSSSSGSGSGGFVWYEGAAIVPSGPGRGSSTPWVLAEALRWCGFDYSELDLASWADAAKIANGLVTYTDQNNVSAQAVRFSSAIAVRQRRPAAELVRGLRQAMGAILVPTSIGKLRLSVEGPLAEQQPAAVDGSNYATPVSSKLRNGNAANGYVAYRFTESNSWDLRADARPIAESPNRVEFPFQDPVNGYAMSTFSLIDSDDRARVDQDVPGGLQVQPEGIASHNHALRVARLGLAKIHRGNPAADTRGTDWWTWKTSFRGCRLEVGQIVMIEAARLGLTAHLVRLTEVKPSRNFEELTLRGHTHVDDWYLDSFGNAADPPYSAKHRDRLPRPAFPWRPDTAAPVPLDSLASGKSFALALLYETLADGTANVRLSLRGKLPVNAFGPLSVPGIAPQANVATTGGTLPGDSIIYVALVAKSAEGLSAPSLLIARGDVPPGTDTNTLTVPVYSWDPATTHHQVYAGTDPNQLQFQFEDSGKPSSVTLTSLAEGPGLPDVEFDRLLVRVKRILHSGVFGVPITSVTSSTITYTTANWTIDQWAGYDVSILAGEAGEDTPVATFRVVSNSEDTLTVIGDPAAAGIAAGWVMVMRSKPVVGSDAGGNYLEDQNWKNTLSGNNLGLAPGAEVGYLLRVIAGPGAGHSYRIKDNSDVRIWIEGDWVETPDSTSRYVVEEPGWVIEHISGPFDNADPSAEVTAIIEVNNYKTVTLLVEAVALDGGGNEGFSRLAPFREIYVAGEPLRSGGGALTIQVEY